MADNKRVFYAIQQVGFAKDGTQTFVAAHGVQSVGITTTFNLENVFELGQLAIYQIVENIPDIEVTLEKVIDGYPLLYHLATNGAPAPGLVGRSTVRTIFGMSVFPDTQVSASGAAIAELQCSGMYVSSFGYNFQVEGNFTENLTLVGNNKLWRDISGGAAQVFTGAFLDNLDAPLSGTTTGGVQHRWNMLFAPISGSPTTLDENGMSNAYCTILPTDLPGITASGTNPAYTDSSFYCSVQNIQISTDLGRDAIYQMGRKTPYFRYVTFPVEVRTEIEIMDRKWDNISATEVGGNNGAPYGQNVKNQTIRVATQDGTRVDLGTRNKLQSVARSGGDAGQGGGNVSNRYSYITYNVLNVYHPADPSQLSG
jgi:hypothetical protein